MSNTYWTDLSEAYEILNLSPIFPPEGNIRDYILTYKGGQDPSVSGDTVMTGDAWVNYVPPDPYTKNKRAIFSSISLILSLHLGLL